MTEYLQRMASYNQWMNERLFAKAGELPAAELAKDRGAFFGSILGTLNHIMVGDLFWLRRFASNKACRETLAGLSEFPTPTTLSDILFDDFAEFTAKRKQLDALIRTFSDTFSEELLAENIRYRNFAGEKHHRPLEAPLQHFFNHQTHHRGQVTTLLSQAGIDPGPTDLMVMLMEES